MVKSFHVLEDFKRLPRLILVTVQLPLYQPKFIVGVSEIMFEDLLDHILIRIPCCHIYGRDKLGIVVKWSKVGNVSGLLLPICEVAKSVPELMRSVDIGH